MIAMAPVSPRASDSVSPSTAWRAVEDRDVRFDGRFVYAVATTGIYCRPTCPSRRPRRDRVRFFGGPEAARAAGYRACRRCHPDDPAPPRAVDAVRRACAHLDAHVDEPVRLPDLGRLVGMSPYHLQRTFKRLTGVSPREYQSAQRTQRLKSKLKGGHSVTTASYGVGYGSSSRLYEQSDARLGMTPSTYRRGGQGMRIQYTTVDSPFGRLLVAATERGLCAVSFGESEAGLLRSLHEEYPQAAVEPGDRDLASWVEAIVAHLSGEKDRLRLPLDVQATAFQWSVWKALQEIPYGETRSYGEVAAALGKPLAVRAVARACATNRLALVVPCHRVVRGDGSAGGYRWGVRRKEQLLARESGGGRAR